jgi:predicted ester cyclase
MKDLKVIGREIVEAWNAHDRERFLSFFEEKLSFEVVPMRDELVGRDAFGVEFFDLWHDAFPDSKIKDVSFVVEGKMIVEEARFVGTHTGVLTFPQHEIPPTGKVVDGPFVAVWELGEHEKIKRGRMFFDRLQLFEQLGVTEMLAVAAV